EGHLAIAPDHYDPTHYIVSFGLFNGEAKQFTLIDETFDPTKIDTTTGLVKYDLTGISYIDSDGMSWNGNRITKDPKLIPNSNNQSSSGCVLFEMLENRKLKMENFPGIQCSDVMGFTE